MQMPVRKVGQGDGKSIGENRSTPPVCQGLANEEWRQPNAHEINNSNSNVGR